MTQFSDVLRVGKAPVYGQTRSGTQGANVQQGGQSFYGDNNLPQWGRGVQIAPLAGMSIQPIASGAALLAASQTPGAAGNLALTAGAGVTTKTIGGTLYYFLDVARCITVTTAGDEHTVSMTVTGLDWWYQLQTQTQALPSSATVGATLKSFLAVSSISVSGGTSGAITCGFNDTIGLLYVCQDKTLLTAVQWNNTLAKDTGTLVVADTTSPATASTGDVRGTYTPSTGAADGSKRLTLTQYVTNPDTDVGRIGVTPA